MQNPDLSILDDLGNDVRGYEVPEREQAIRHVRPDDVVLELGARFGGVSIVTNHILSDRKAHVVVEPDSRVWAALYLNRQRNGCEFQIIEGIVSDKKKRLVLDPGIGYGTYAELSDDDSGVAIWSLPQIRERCAISTPFTVLIADCEGCLFEFLEENPHIYDDVRLMMIEEDAPDRCDYASIAERLTEKGWMHIERGFHSVWIKSPTASQVK
jgi:FkbM family methyltransferase